MNFDFSTEQKAFGEQLRRSLEDAGAIAETRRCLEGQMRHSTRIWGDLAALGALGAALPEPFGGAGLSLLESCIVAVEVRSTVGRGSCFTILANASGPV